MTKADAECFEDGRITIAWTKLFMEAGISERLSQRSWCRCTPTSCQEIELLKSGPNSESMKQLGRFWPTFTPGGPPGH